MSADVFQDPRIGVTHNRALCCECGCLRLVKNGAGFSNNVTEGWDSELIQYVRNKYPGRLTGVEPGFRMLGDLKCASCGKVTRHARLRDAGAWAEGRDSAENSDYPYVPTPMERLEAADIRLRRVEDLEERCIYYRKSKLLLVDVLSTDAEVNHAIERVLKRA